MSRSMLATLLALSFLLIATPAIAQTSTRDEIRLIEQEYASQHNGRMIPDTQLEYYLDRADSGWTMNQISQDMTSARRQYANSQWRPQSGWVARELVCSSESNKYRECAAPFRGRARVTHQISQSACVEGQSWGQKSGVIWVNRGCRARFGMIPGSNASNSDDHRTIVCKSKQSRYHECNIGSNRPVVLVKRLGNSTSCTEGRSWGQRNGKIWVNHGCRAQFRTDDRWNGNGNWNDDYAVTCSSNNNAQVRCNWDSRFGRPHLQQQLSQSACVEGRSWGYDNRNAIWVSNGCRAQFVSSQNRYGNNNGGNYYNSSNYEVTCSSASNDLTRCNWDSRYGQPRMVQKLSQSACTQNRSWGYDNRGLWVDDGCRARFANH